MVTESVDALDESLFDRIPSQTTSDDRRALLAVQSAVARHFGRYCYLEIGSHLGGSIQPHLLDPRCRRIYSIDPRPASQPDDRGVLCHYPDNSTERMLDGLSTVAADELGKLRTFELDARDLDSGRIDDPPHLCFIDGEHTTEAVLGDFDFCRTVCHPDGAICFHDANVVWMAVWRIARRLRRRQVACSTMVLPGSVVAIALADSPVRRDATVRSMSRSPTRAVLTAALHDVYRRGRGVTRTTSRHIGRFGHQPETGGGEEPGQCPADHPGYGPIEK